MEALFISKALFWSSKLTFTIKFLGGLKIAQKPGLKRFSPFKLKGRRLVCLRRERRNMKKRSPRKANQLQAHNCA